MSKSKPWLTCKRCQGLQYREYPEGKSYRVKIGRHPNTYTASLGIMDEVEAIRIVAELKENRATGVGFQTIAEMDAIAIEMAQAENIAQERERKQLIADDAFAQANTVGTFWDKVYWPKRGVKGSGHNNGSMRGVFNNHVRPVVGDIPLTELKYTDVEAMRDAMYAKELSPKTVKHAYTVLQSMYNYAILHLSAHNDISLKIFPGKILDKPKLNNAKTCWLEYGEAKCLLNMLYNWREICAPHKLRFKGRDTKDAYGMAVLALFCGLRFGDIADLKWSKLENTYAHTNKSKSGKAYGVHLDIPIVKEMIEERKKLFPKAAPDDYVFLNFKKNKWTEVPDVFFDALEESQLNFTRRRINDEKEKMDFHGLRHTFASWLVIKGTPLPEIMVLMDHKSMQMTLRYARLDPEYTQRHVAALAADFNEKTSIKTE